MAAGFFRFGKKSPPKAKLPVFQYSLSEIPLFSSLGPSELKLIEEKIRRVEYKKGDSVYRVGEEADAFYIILSGRFRVLNPRGTVLATLSHGDYFGESSLLLSRPHSATVEAKNDGLVLKITKDDFVKLLSAIPSLSVHLSRTLGHRLTRGISRTEVAEAKILSLLNVGAEREKMVFARNLSASLAYGKKKVLLVGFENEAQSRFQDQGVPPLEFSDAHSSEFSYVHSFIHERDGKFHFLRVAGRLEKTSGAVPNVPLLLSFLIDHFDIVLLDLPFELGEMGIKAVQQSDLVYFLVAEDQRNSEKTKALLREFEASFGFTHAKIRFILCEQTNTNAASFIPYGMHEPSAMEVFGILPYEKELYERDDPASLPFVLRVSDAPYAKAVRYLARELTGNLVGLALGSGAAFGFAYIGVLKVLEEENIPIDLIAGASMGALIGAMWASGLNAQALTEIGRSLDQKTTFMKLIGLRDFSLPHLAFFKGIQVMRFLRSYLGRKTFRMLHTPVKIVTANLFTGEEVILDEGDVVEAIRASISIPGIFRPVKVRGQYLIDGGVIDPLPVKVLSHFGAKKIIAVNVLSSAEDHTRRKEFFERQAAKFEEELLKKSFFDRLWHRARRGLIQRYQPNTLNVLMNTIQFLEYGIAESQAQAADIVIHPVRHDGHWAEFYSAGKFIEEGERKTREQMSEIKRLVEEST